MQKDIILQGDLQKRGYTHVNMSLRKRINYERIELIIRKESGATSTKTGVAPT